LHVFNKHVLCENKFCDFRAGTAFDLLAAIEGSYEKALITARAAYSTRFAHISLADGLDAVDNLKKQRKLFDFFALYGRPTDTIGAINFVRARSWLRSVGMDADIQPSSILCLSKMQFLQLIEIAEDYSTKKKVSRRAIGKNGITIVIPVFAAPSVIAGFMYFPAHSQSSAVLHHFEECRFGFTGLLDYNPRNIKPTLFTEFTKALEYNTLCAKTDRSNFGASLVYEPRAKPQDWGFATMTYRPQPKEFLGLLKGVSEIAANCNVSVLVNEVMGEIPWKDFVKVKLIDQIVSSGVNKDTENLLNVFQLEDEIYTEVCKELEALNKFEAVYELNKVRQTKSLFTEDNLDFYKNAEGYYVVHPDGTKTTLTNFTCDFTKNIFFPDASLYCHTGTMYFNSIKYPLSVSSLDLSSAAALEGQARLAEFKNVNLNVEGSALPSITERKYSKHLLEYFRRLTSKLPRTEGVDNLGWSKRKQGFWTPWGKLTKQDWETDTRTPNPAHEFWDCYNLNMQPVPAAVHANVPRVLADLISKIVGLIGRSYSDFSLKPLPIIFTSDGHHLLRNIFRALGQMEPFSFSARSSSNLEVKGVRGFPMLVTGATKGQIERGTQSLVALGEVGQPIYGTVTDEELSEIMRMLPWLIRSCVQWILQTEGANFKLFNSVDYGTALSREGASIINSATNLEWPISTPVYLRLERVLNQIPFSLTKDFITQHLLDQNIIISVNGLDVNMEELYLELTTTCKRVTATANSVAVDSISMLGLLSNFYGQVPMMTRAGVPTAAQIATMG